MHVADTQAGAYARDLDQIRPPSKDKYTAAAPLLHGRIIIPRSSENELAIFMPTRSREIRMSRSIGVLDGVANNLDPRWTISGPMYDQFRSSIFLHAYVEKGDSKTRPKSWFIAAIWETLARAEQSQQLPIKKNQSNNQVTNIT